MRTYWFVVLAVFAGATVVFAGDPATSASIAASLPKALLSGAIAGAIAATLGLLKAKNDDGTHEDFDFASFGITIVIGAIVGVIAKWQNKDLSDVATYLDTAPVALAADVIFKAFHRNVPAVIGKVGGIIKSGIGSAGGGGTNPTKPS